VKLEKQLAILDECGFRIPPGLTVDRLLVRQSRREYERDPFVSALCALGQMEGAEVDQPASNIWHFDTECIESEGDYVRIARHMRALAEGDLPLIDLRDGFEGDDEFDYGPAWLEFRLHGRSHRWVFRVDDDWVDPTVLSKFAHLLDQAETSKRFTYYGLNGQDFLIGCSTPNQLSTIRKRTGLRFTWLGSARL